MRTITTPVGWALTDRCLKQPSYSRGELFHGYSLPLVKYVGLTLNFTAIGQHFYIGLWRDEFGGTPKSFCMWQYKVFKINDSLDVLEQQFIQEIDDFMGRLEANDLATMARLKFSIHWLFQ